MKTIGLLSLTRFGDLIQTSPITNGLHRRYPDARIHMIVKTRFRRVAQMLPHVDEVHDIDGDALARAMTDPGTPFSEPYRMVRDIVEDLKRIPFDLLLNFTHSRSSAVLLSLLNAKRTVGFTMDRSGIRRVDDQWLVHMGTLVRARKLFRLNLVDVYLGAAGLLGQGERLGVNIPGSSRQLADSMLGGHGPFVAVQLGASQDAKTWSVAHYARTLTALRERVSGLTAVLVGVPAEAARADALREACPKLRMKRLIGETSIEELAAVLERCQLLLTGDTGTMHLAAAVGTPTCSVFVGLGNPYETAPYAEGHVALRSRLECAPCSHLVRCGNPVCHDDIPPEWLAGVIERMLQRKSLQSIPALPRADLLETRFDDHGMLELEPVHERAPSAEDLLGLAYHAIFREDLAGISLRADEVRELARNRYRCEPEDWANLVPSEILAALERLEGFGRQAANLAESLVSVPKSEVSRRGEQLAEIDASIYAIGRADPMVAPLCLSLEGESESLPGEKLDEIAAASSANYARLARRAHDLTRLIRNLDVSKGRPDASRASKEGKR